jgi:hypothetical protein
MSTAYGARAGRHVHRQSRGIKAAWLLAVVLWCSVAALAWSMLGPARAADWVEVASSPATLAAIDTLVAGAVSEAALYGEAGVVLSERQIAGWLASKSRADRVQAIAVSIEGPGARVLMRVRAFGRLAATLEVLVVPSLFDDRVFLAVQATRIGRLPVPQPLSDLVLSRVTPGGPGSDPASGWAHVNGKLGLVCPASLSAAGRVVRIVEVFCAAGRVELLVEGGGL